MAVYTVDEAQMELFIALPSNYPLGGPDVQLNRQIGGLPHKQWLMQLRMCLLHQVNKVICYLSNEHLLIFKFSSRMVEFGMHSQCGTTI